MIQSKNYKLYFTVYILEYIDYAVEYNVFKNELCISTISSTFKLLLIFFLFIFGFWHSQKELLSETRNRGRK